MEIVGQCLLLYHKILYKKSKKNIENKNCTKNGINCTDKYFVKEISPKITGVPARSR